MATLELDDITKHFDDDGETIVAVDDASIDIDDGEFLVLVGPSGCGKSTTLRMIAGLETITSGELRIGGRRVNEAKPRDRDIAMVFQSYALYPHMSVRENMSFGLEESTDLSDDEIDARVESATDTMGITDLLDRKPTELSGGQQQRVALGRAIVREPEVFLMDEPLSNLDAKLRAQMRTELQRLQEDLDTTTVYVTHDQTEAMTMGDRIAILNDGILQQVATPLEAYHTPANQFVAGFIGEPSMNFFNVELEGESVVGDGLDYPVSDGVREKLTTDSLILGIRPQDIELVEDVESGHDVAVTVDVVEPMGDENNIYLSLPETRDGETFIANVDGRSLVAEGEDTVARIPEQAVHFFDRRSGEALRNREFDDADVDLSL
ncbi:ABC transporter ATP-binding protein [Halarchaeum salinum]|uniref:ABC-type D-xylose/L-arabinose transporter n=1 Tax=Halarchaeum salinum TaxID=489912 RepID=A0AAV3S8H3_9EURY